MAERIQMANTFFLLHSGSQLETGIGVGVRLRDGAFVFGVAGFLCGSLMLNSPCSLMKTFMVRKLLKINNE